MIRIETVSDLIRLLKHSDEQEAIYFFLSERQVELEIHNVCSTAGGRATAIHFNTKHTDKDHIHLHIELVFYCSKILYQQL